ncbi:hypothetical protein B23_3086 [Geobacillus thermoleovorans B23]|nr:hypothetical protein B23_3086 [Geobacillus thermoleovorans B23]
MVVLPVCPFSQEKKRCGGFARLIAAFAGATPKRRSPRPGNKEVELSLMATKNAACGHSKRLYSSLANINFRVRE